MNKNRIEGRHSALRWHKQRKRTGMLVEVNAAAVQRSNVSLPGEISPPRGGEKSAEAILPRICTALENGTYRPAAVRRVEIPKPDGSKRPLGVPTVLDRMIQQAVAQVLTPLFDAEFSEHGYGFREGRGAHNAARQVEAGWKERRRHAE